MSRKDGIPQRAREGGAVMSRDGRADILLLQYLHFHHPWWSAENCSMHFPHYPHPCGAYSAKSQEGGADVYWPGE